ncbi:hypothetical protein [Novosphingobium taihuense]|uniref:Uncharacterized protein n=1 Tax=Novosphingobium taihuense TaxID=260085 RepID=A0A7W7ADC5_9SPHN|nr:hypothetical protein [Novosphingobium taihuense]MBB4614022.1 hypothetical protein [Novosphingobium taihuense]
MTLDAVLTCFPPLFQEAVLVPAPSDPSFLIVTIRSLLAVVSLRLFRAKNKFHDARIGLAGQGTQPLPCALQRYQV